jgi:protein-disulfide isomerase
MITYIVFNFPLERVHPKARKAAQAAECAARQGKYWEMHEHMFNHQDNLGEDGLRDAAVVLGLQMPEFDRCLAGEADVVVSADIKEGSRLGVTSTPAFFLGKIQADGSIELMKRFRGSAPLEVFEKLVGEVAHQKRFWLWSLFSAS